MSDPGPGLTFNGLLKNRGSGGGGLTFNNNPLGAPSAPGVPAGGSGAMDALLARGGGASAPAAPAAQPSRGGILGFLGRAASGLVNAVKGAPTGIGRLAQDVGTAGGRGLENVANDVGYAATLGHMGGYDTRHLGGSEETPNFTSPGSSTSIINTNPHALGQAIAKYPSLEGIRAGYVKSGEEIAHPTQLAHDLYTDPTGTVLNTAANILPFLHGASVAAEGSRLGELAGKATEGAHAVAMAPLRPFISAGGAVGDLVGGTSAGAKLAAVGDRISQAAANSKAGALVHGLGLEARAPIDDLARENQRIVGSIKASPDEFAAAVLRAQGHAPLLEQLAAHPEAQPVVDNLLKNLGSAEGKAPSMEAARLAVVPNENVIAAEHALRDVSANRTQLGMNMGLVSPDQLTPAPRQAVIEDLTKQPAAIAERTAKVAELLRARADNAATRAAQPVEVPLENGGIPSLLSAHEASLRANEAAVNAGTRAETALNKAENARVKPTYTEAMNGQLPTDNPRNTIDMLRQAHARLAAGEEPTTPLEKTLARQQAVEGRATAANETVGEKGEKVISTYVGRGKAAGLVEGTRQGEANIHERLARIAERRASAAADRLDQVRAQAEDSLKAAPAAHRTPLAAVRSVMGDLSAEAEKDPSAADHLTQIAKDLEPMSHLKFWADQEQQPAHIIQPKTAQIARAIRGESSGNPVGGAAVKRPGETFERKGFSTFYDQKGQANLERTRLLEKAHNAVIAKVDSTVGKSAADVLGADTKGLKGEQLYKAMKAEGYEAWNPKNPQVRGALATPQTVDATTRWLPKPVLTELTRTFAQDEPKSLPDLAAKSVGRGIDKATRVLYRSTLGLSPHYALLRTVGNALMATVKGDVAPQDLISRAAEATRLIAHGEAPASYDRFLNDEVSQPGRFGRVTQAVPRFLDKAARTAVFLDQLDKNGGDYEKAVRAGNEAMGDYAGMSARERGVLGRVFPSYSWMKAVSQAAAKLGAEHPASVLWALHLGDVAAKNPQAFKQGPVAAEFNPLSIFTAGPSLVNPIVRAAVGAGTGFNLSKMKDVSRPPDQKQTGPLPAKDLAYFLSNQLPAGKLFNQSPLSGKDQDVARYDTGQLHLGPKGRTLPAYVPPSKTPLGTFGPYFRQFLANPQVPKANPAGTIAHAKAVKAADKRGKTYEREVKALGSRGIR